MASDLGHYTLPTKPKAGTEPIHVLSHRFGEGGSLIENEGNVIKIQLLHARSDPPSRLSGLTGPLEVADD